MTRRIETPTERLAWLIVVATIPAGVIGIVSRTSAAGGAGQADGGGLLPDPERRHPPRGRTAAAPRPRCGSLAVREGAKADGGRKLETLDYKEAVVIGVAQSSALIAGISRDGVCMTAGLVRGLDHEDSARFAFLLATPVILAAGLFKFSDLTGPLGDGVRPEA